MSKFPNDAIPGGEDIKIDAKPTAHRCRGKNTCASTLSICDHSIEIHTSLCEHNKSPFGAAVG